VATWNLILCTPTLISNELGEDFKGIDHSLLSSMVPSIFPGGTEENQNKFYIHGSVHCESNLITVQQDATYSVYYISVGSSTCFG